MKSNVAIKLNHFYGIAYTYDEDVGLCKLFDDELHYWSEEQKKRKTNTKQNIGG